MKVLCDSCRHEGSKYYRKKINANADMHFFRQIKVASFIPDIITKESILLFKIPIVQYRKHNVLLVYQWFHKIPWYNMLRPMVCNAIAALRYSTS